MYENMNPIVDMYDERSKTGELKMEQAARDEEIKLEKRRKEKAILVETRSGNKKCEKIESAINKLREDRRKEFEKIQKKRELEVKDILGQVEVKPDNEELQSFLTYDEISSLEKFNYLIDTMQKRLNKERKQFYIEQIPVLEKECGKIENQIDDLENKLSEMISQKEQIHFRIKTMKHWKDSSLDTRYYHSVLDDRSPMSEKIKYVLEY